MSKANERQEGGNHYRQPDGIPQHWDLAVLYKWDPFQYQITKYVMRWKDKHSTPEACYTDLKKGFHFYEKYLEVWREYYGLPAEQIRAIHTERTQADVDLEHEQQNQAMQFFQPDGFNKEGNGYQCVNCRAVIMAGSPLGALRKHACALAPTPGATGAL